MGRGLSKCQQIYFLHKKITQILKNNNNNKTTIFVTYPEWYLNHAFDIICPGFELSITSVSASTTETEEMEKHSLLKHCLHYPG